MSKPITPAIVHLGAGAFFRAHTALYTDEAMKASGDYSWGIIAARLFHGETFAEQFRQQDHQYSVMETGTDGSQTVKTVNAVVDILAVREDRRPLLAWLCNPVIRIVSLTITEKGYNMDLADDALLQHDLQHIDHPKTAMGLIVSALLTRWQNGTEPFTVLSCDNLSNNGEKIRNAVLQLAQKVSPKLAQWIAGQVRFPATMVDRIVPAMSEQSYSEVASALGQPDPCAIASEAFRQWVVEDNFTQGRPKWELVNGATLVASASDVTAHECMKLRMLNGSHSLLAYLGCLAGYQTVAEAVSNPDIQHLVRRYMLEEAAVTLTGTSRAQAGQYCNQLMARFANPFLKHQTSQIAMDGSQKIPQRWLEGLTALQENSCNYDCTALGLAAWIKFLCGQDDQGKALTIRDPMKDRLQAVIKRHQPDHRAMVSAVLALINASHPTQQAARELNDRVLFYLEQLNTSGTLQTLARHFATTESQP